MTFIKKLHLAVAAFIFLVAAAEGSTALQTFDGPEARGLGTCRATLLRDYGSWARLMFTVTSPTNEVVHLEVYPVDLKSDPLSLLKAYEYSSRGGENTSEHPTRIMRFRIDEPNGIAGAFLIRNLEGRIFSIYSCPEMRRL